MPRKLGLIAGLGELPVQIANEARESGRPVYVLRLAGFVERQLSEFEGEIVGIGEVGRQIKLLKSANCEDVVFAGIVKRPDFSNLKLDMRGARLLPKVLAAARKGDDALLRTLVGTFEKEGFRVVGAEEVSGKLLAAEGAICGDEPVEEILSDMKRAAEVAGIIGKQDIGQACVVRAGLVIAVEAQEGTDEMLKRVAMLPKGEGGGVLVKRPKPIQERRIDLPTIGEGTIEAASSAGLVAIGLEADGALILDLMACKKKARELGIAIYGFPKDWG